MTLLKCVQYMFIIFKSYLFNAIKRLHFITSLSKIHIAMQVLDGS